VILEIMKKAGIFLLFILLLSCSGDNKIPEVRIADPEEVGINPSLEKELDTYINALIDEQRIPGAVCLLAKDDKVVHLKSYGWRNIENGLKMSNGSIFRIASMTKPIVSVGIMMLNEEGIIDLEDPVSSYIPILSDLERCVNHWENVRDGVPLKVVKADSLRIKHLLNHSSGYTAAWIGGKIGNMYSAIEDNLEKGNYSSLEEYIQDISEIPLINQPGLAFEYGHSTNILGYLIESVSGESLDEFLTKKIFDPLKMNSTGFNVSEELSDLIALYYSAEGGVLKYKKLVEGEEYTDVFMGGTGLSSTIEDYYLFCRMLLHKGAIGGVRILKESTVDLMTQVSIDAKNLSWLKGYDFGLGFAIRTDNSEAQMKGSIGEYCWIGMYGTAFWIDPKEHIIGLLFTQADPLNNYPPYNQSMDDYYYASKEMRNIVYNALEDQ
jgi:CubicO group peptidase (beta-lactamase class C family)